MSATSGLEAPPRWVVELELTTGPVYPAELDPDWPADAWPTSYATSEVAACALLERAAGHYAALAAAGAAPTVGHVQLRDRETEPPPSPPAIRRRIGRR